MIHLRFPNHEKGFSMDAKYAWFFSAPRAGDDYNSNYKISERETAAKCLSKRMVFDVPLRRRYSGILVCASSKLNKDVESADALSFSGTER